MLQGDTKGARREFERAAELPSNGRANVAGVLALAGLQFQQGAYAAALALYQRALRKHPGCPAEVRLGVAACLFRCAPAGVRPPLHPGCPYFPGAVTGLEVVSGSASLTRDRGQAPGQV